MPEPADLTEATAADLDLLRQAVELARQSPAGHTYAVGAVIADADGVVLSTGYSRETGPLEHAEEVALAKLEPGELGGPRLATATLYSSLEPCSVRLSRPRTCTDLIIAAGIPRVVFAWREPELTVDCEGAELLAAAGRTVVEVPELAPLVRQVNAGVLGRLGLWPPDAAGVLRLPSGRLVRGRGLRRPEPAGPRPTFGLYLLGSRPPAVDWPSRWLRWPDFRLPADRAEADEALRDAWQRAESERVELACHGGQGRTGTALACLAVLDGVPGDEAVAYVRENYSPRAVETPWQRRYVRRFGKP